MQIQEFAKFVASQQDAASSAQVDWQEIRREWLINLVGLYTQVGPFLKEFVANQSISTSFTQVELDEENLRAYTANRMDIRIGRQRIYLGPIGTLIIGSQGSYQRNRQLRGGK